MDGVPLVTQCPISPASTFRYKFIAEKPGTHFYHSHSGILSPFIILSILLTDKRIYKLQKKNGLTGFQRADGVFGPLIIRQSRDKDPHSMLYDHDLPEHVILVSDWLGELGVAKFVAHHHDDGDNKPSSMIINGRGRLPKQRGELTTNETMPLSLFSVDQVGQGFTTDIFLRHALIFPVLILPYNQG